MPGRLLIVEDSEDLRECLGEILADQGYEIAFARDGQDALRQVRTAPPDLILLDVMMPVMDGVQFLEELAALRPASAIPVIVMTAAEGLPISAPNIRGTLPKPFDPPELLDKVRDALG